MRMKILIKIRRMVNEAMAWFGKLFTLKPNLSRNHKNKSPTQSQTAPTANGSRVSTINYGNFLKAIEDHQPLRVAMLSDVFVVAWLTIPTLPEGLEL